ncbi:Com family DNA-binding transcriptional regulator [Desulfohalovibrio reitneri]|uniref:Com family DNA-binding transcriptional regulator n=1 Tax=Desulfohalovibrio reitneri TaxID=1307759 RepID=UPI000ABFBE27|nr:Com family DNA-binding transcriptional regulator [Desulfohalovibrio reitneri]
MNPVKDVTCGECGKAFATAASLCALRCPRCGSNRSLRAQPRLPEELRAARDATPGRTA